ncbi:hypothetical protein BV22DRAFT_1131727 [Leucogyrophana mollusca]|uniref:Uncharacterized protein n=1 Tax=Leucogyrophana mollusca TaxID=85980 RepID=A0ACB8B948_9AGAM|nr:hypothetical protein BV22DRAFT_1131727 [Leucogyrophana mollusca]
MISLLVVYSLLALGARAQNSTGLAPKQYHYLPLGKIKPTGWLYDQLMVQTNGLAGHEHDFYDYVAQSDWIGGNSTYSNLEEAGSYWFPRALISHSGLIPHVPHLSDPSV